MGTTAQKLTYLNETKSQLKDTINYSGASITDDTFRQYPRKLYTQYLDILKEPDTLFNGMPKVPEQTGTELSLNDTANTRTKIELNPSELTQETTRGDNLFNFNDMSVTALGSIGTVSVQNDVISYTANGDNVYGIKMDISNLKNNTTYTVSNLINTTAQLGAANGWRYYNGTSYTTLNSYHTYFTFTTTNSGTNQLLFYIGTPAIYNGTLTLSKIQLLEGNIAEANIPSYEPYTGGIPQPNPNYPSEVQVIKGNNSIIVSNKNLFNPNNVVDGETYATNGSIASSGGSCRTVNYVYCHGSAITISGLPSESGRMIMYDKNKNAIDYWPLKNRTISSANNVYYFRLGTDKTNKSILQVELNSTATSYVAHQEQVLPINLGVINLLNISDIQPQKTVIGSGVGGNFSLDNNANRGSIIVSVKPNTQYTVSVKSGFYLRRISEFASNNLTNCLVDYQLYNTGLVETKTFITNANTNYIAIAIQSNPETTMTQEKCEASELQLVFETSRQYISDNPIEYCKIGTYEDEFEHDGDKWYINKAIRKVVLDGSETWVYGGSNETLTYIINENISGLKKNTRMLSNYFGSIGNNRIDVSVSTNEKIVLYIENSIVGIETSDNNPTKRTKIQNWLSSHNTDLYYILETPTHTEITDTTLISQLNAIEQALSYDGQTNISQTNAGLPFRIKASAIKNLESVFE